MRKTILFIFILVFTFLAAQDYNNLYSPWGFNAPFLKSGEFVLTARGYTNCSDSEYFYDNDPDRYSNSESSSLYFYTRAMLALTDKFLINTTLYLYPGRETSRSFSGNTGYDQENWYTLKTYLYPYITLIYRPVKNLEISGAFSYRTYDYASDRIHNDEEIHNYDQTYQYTNLNINVNYFGKLWGK